MDYTDTNFKGIPGPGRPKGSQNKITKERREKLEMLLELADEKLYEALEKLKPKELIDMWVTLQEYVLPKLQRVSLDVDGDKDMSIKFIFEVVGENGLPLPDTDPRDE